jgi:hypothetical protein
MKNKIKLAALLAASMFTASASAAPIVLDFEGVGNVATINDFYNGGTDSQGHSGTNYGISFSSSALALRDSDAGGSGNIANEPSGNTGMFFLSGSAILNRALGFDTGFSFFYSSSTAAVVNVYEGLNATGALLGSINLTAQYGDNCHGDPGGSFCNFSAAGLSFAGTAHSIDFGGTANQIVFDDITFGAAVPGADVPEPGTLALLGLGLFGTVAARRRSSKR